MAATAAQDRGLSCRLFTEIDLELAGFTDNDRTRDCANSTVRSEVGDIGCHSVSQSVTRWSGF